MRPITFYIYLFALFGASLHAAFHFPAMPTEMAVHFGPEGRADLWSAREAYFALVFAMIGLNAAVFGFAPWIAEMARFRKLGIPNREYWMAAGRILGFYSFFRGRLAWFGAGNVCFLAFVNQLVFDANGYPGYFDGNRFIAGLAAYFVFVIIWLLLLYRRLSAAKGTKG